MSHYSVEIKDLDMMGQNQQLQARRTGYYTDLRDDTYRVLAYIGDTQMLVCPWSEAPSVRPWTQVAAENGTTEAAE